MDRGRPLDVLVLEHLQDGLRELEVLKAAHWGLGVLSLADDVPLFSDVVTLLARHLPDVLGWTPAERANERERESERE